MVMHYSRNEPAGSSQPIYLASTAVFLVEVIKLLSSLFLAARDIQLTNPKSNAAEIAVKLYHSVFSPDSWKLIVPAALYTLQNSLVYVAVSNLDAITFQVTYQIKILTTVLFSILLLGRRISSRQWLALVMLTFGVAMVQVSGSLGLEDWKERLTSLLQGGGVPSPLKTAGSSGVKGLLAVLAASLTSGLTCVYFEKLVKDSLASVSLWTRNVQLSFFSLFPALLIGVIWQDGAAIARDGFFAGYGPIVWLTITLQAFGGLIVALCITYADNVAKNFAASFSIVLSYAASAVVFKTPLILHSTGGAAIVLLAIYLFNSRPSPGHALLPLRESDGPAPKPLLFQILKPK
ncbi:Nucleotide-sugar transporter domain containing protein [Naviculisporaceae sp. PSN 640]